MSMLGRCGNVVAKAVKKQGVGVDLNAYRARLLSRTESASRMAQPDHTPAAAQDKSPLVGPALALSRAIQGRIGNELLAMYEASSCEPVPVRLIELMNRLERTTPPDDR